MGSIKHSCSPWWSWWQGRATYMVAGAVGARQSRIARRLPNLEDPFELL